MADEMYEVLLLDGGQRWHVGFVVGEQTDLLLRSGGGVAAFRSRAALEHAAQRARVELSDDLPDEIDLDLGGWLSQGTPEPPAQDVSELWHLLLDDPDAGRPLRGEEVEEAPEWFREHGPRARRALSEAVRRLRGVLRPA